MVFHSYMGLILCGEKSKLNAKFSPENGAKSSAITSYRSNFMPIYEALICPLCHTSLKNIRRIPSDDYNCSGLPNDWRNMSPREFHCFHCQRYFLVLPGNLHYTYHFGVWSPTSLEKKIIKRGGTIIGEYQIHS